MKVWDEDLGWVERSSRRPRHTDPRLRALALPPGVTPTRRLGRFVRSLPALVEVAAGQVFQRAGVLNQWVFAVLEGSVVVTVSSAPVALVTSGAWLVESLHPTVTLSALTAVDPTTLAVFDIRHMATVQAVVPGLEEALLRAGRHVAVPTSPAAARYGWR